MAVSATRACWRSPDGFLYGGWFGSDDEMLAHFAVFSPASQVLFFAGTYAAEATKEHPKPTIGRIFIWQDAQSVFPYSEPLGTMPCKAETAELAQ
jgi:hypothetical protein